MLAAQARALPVRRGADVRGVRPRRGLLLGDSRPRRRGGPRSTGSQCARATPRTTPVRAPDDDRVRRAVLGRPLGRPLRCPGRKSACRHAVAALRHVADGRTPADRGRARSREPSAGRTRALLGLALVYLGEHYVVDLLGRRGADRERATRGAARRRRWCAPSRGWFRRSKRGRPRGSPGWPVTPPSSDGRRRERVHPWPRFGRGRTPTRPTTRAGRRCRASPGGDAARPVHAPAAAASRSLFVVSTVAFLYFVLPQAARPAGDLEPDPARERLVARARRWCSRCCSFVGYVALFRAVFVRGESRIDWRESYQITMAGLAATRLFASAGAGGIALTAWALRRSGMEPRMVACRHDRLPGRCSTASTWCTLVIDRPRAVRRPVPRPGAVRDHRRAGDLRRRR